jgi:hypothetical protein
MTKTIRLFDKASQNQMFTITSAKSCNENTNNNDDNDLMNE